MSSPVLELIHNHTKKLGAFDDEQVKRLQYLLVYEWKIPNNEIFINLEEKLIQIKTSDNEQKRFLIKPKEHALVKLKAWLVTDFEIEFI